MPDQGRPPPASGGAGLAQLARRAEAAWWRRGEKRRERVGIMEWVGGGVSMWSVEDTAGVSHKFGPKINLNIH